MEEFWVWSQKAIEIAGCGEQLRYRFYKTNYERGVSAQDFAKLLKAQVRSELVVDTNVF